MVNIALFNFVFPAISTFDGRALPDWRIFIEIEFIDVN